MKYNNIFCGDILFAKVDDMEYVVRVVEKEPNNIKVLNVRNGETFYVRASRLSHTRSKKQPSHPFLRAQDYRRISL